MRARRPVALTFAGLAPTMMGTHFTRKAPRLFGIGPTEIVLVLVIALLVFGPKRLPELGRQIGRAMAEVRKVTDGLGGTLNANLDPAEPTSQSASGAAPAGAAAPAAQPAAATEVAVPSYDGPGAAEVSADDPSLDTVSADPS